MIPKPNNFISMSIHSNKYYYLIKALRVQKQQSQIAKVLRENKFRKVAGNGNLLTPQKISSIIDLDNSVQLDEKDSKTVVKLNDGDNNQTQFSRLWQQFQKRSLVSKLTAEALPIQIKIAQSKDQKLIDVLLQDAERERQNREAQLAQIGVQVREQQQEVTLLKQQAIQLGLQLQAIDKELVDLKENFDRQEKKINQRSHKYKQQKSKDIMIKNIDRDDMQMRKAMASKIKLNQELDFGFQLQRRRSFNQSKALINQRKKAIQDKLNKLKAVIAQHQTTQNKLIAKKTQLQQKNQKNVQQQVYFCKKVVKNFRGHSRGIQWIIKLLQKLGIKLQKQDLPQQISKDDAALVTTFLGQLKTNNSQRKSKNTADTKKSQTLNKFNHHFRTEPNLIENVQKRNRPSIEKKKIHSKTTVYFDIESQGGPHSEAKESTREKATSFNINTKSLKKIYEHAGHVIGNMIKNHSMNYNSCRLIASSSLNAAEPQNLLERSMIEQKIKAKFLSVRQKDRKNNLKQLLFGKK